MNLRDAKATSKLLHALQVTQILTPTGLQAAVTTTTRAPATTGISAGRVSS